MTTRPVASPAVADRPGTGRWGEALAAFEARVERFEVALRRGDMDALPSDWQPPPDLDEPPTDDERARAEALLHRSRACEQRLGALLQAVTAELHGLRARSEAASSYTA